MALFLLFSVIGSFGWFCMVNLHKNIQLMLEFLKKSRTILGPTFCYYILMGFLMMLSIILLFVRMILLSTLNVIWFVATTRSDFWTWIWSARHCGLEQKMACWFQCSKNATSFVWLVWSESTGGIDVNIDLLICWGWLSLLNWIVTLTLSLLLKLPPRKLEP